MNPDADIRTLSLMEASSNLTWSKAVMETLVSWEDARRRSAIYQREIHEAKNEGVTGPYNQESALTHTPDTGEG